MSRVAALVALVVAVGCADDGEREVHDFAPPAATQEAPSQSAPEPEPEPEASEPAPQPQLRFLENGPVYYDVSGLEPIQKLVVQQVMDRINDAAGVDAVAIDVPGDDFRVYGTINVHLAGCELSEKAAGFATWNFGKMRSSICVEWKDDRLTTITIITHEILHTLGIGHDHDDNRSVMAEMAVANQQIRPHHVAHIRRLAGLEG
jgi:hypothetical protein